ncbi:MAG: hypothetical protein JW783_07990 [Bacteroidales bacterium]|nr:hypothetical protein [Bacteroidales bacterium]MBN2749880.1 hypothetical protein [Bacteroidales bacterium]
MMKSNSTYPTEPKQNYSLAELRDYFNSLSIAMDLQSDAAFVVDINGTVQIWNKSIESITLVNRVQLLGNNQSQIGMVLYGCEKPTLAELVLTNRVTTQTLYPITQTDTNTYTSSLTFKSGKQQEAAYIITASRLFFRNQLIGVIQVIKSLTSLFEEDLFFNGIKNERLRIAKDLHDELGVLVSTQKIFLNLLKEELKANPRCTEYLEYSLDISNQTISACNRLTSELKSDRYQNTIAQALHSLAKLINSTGLLALDVAVDKRVNGIDEQTQTTLYKILKELVNNTLKHSKARNAKITLNLEANTVSLLYADNGIGIDAAHYSHAPQTIGVKSITERLNGIGAKWQLHTEPQKGIQLNAQIDLRK